MEQEKTDALKKANEEKEQLEQEKIAALDKINKEKDKLHQEKADDAEKAKKEKQDWQEASKKREIEMEQKMQASKDSRMIEEEDVDNDREGFTPEVYSFIKKNNDLSVITNIANASLYSIRNQVQVYSTMQKSLTPLNMKQTFISLTKVRDASGNVIIDKNPGKAEVEIILNDDFYGKVLKDMGLKRYVDIPEEAQKLDKMLIEIGALVQKQLDGKVIKVINLDVLISAMRVYKYEYSGFAL